MAPLLITHVTMQTKRTFFWKYSTMVLFGSIFARTPWNTKCKSDSRQKRDWFGYINYKKTMKMPMKESLFKDWMKITTYRLNWKWEKTLKRCKKWWNTWSCGTIRLLLHYIYHKESIMRDQIDACLLLEIAFWSKVSYFFSLWFFPCNIYSKYSIKTFHKIP